MVSQDLIQSVQEKLLSDKKRLEEELSAIGRKSADGTNYTAAWEEYGSNEEDNAAEVAAYGDSLGLSQTLESELHEVNSALERIAQSTYGLCSKCGMEIPDARLQARPMSVMCVACQEKSEIG